MEKLGQFKKGDDPRRNLEGRPPASKNFATKVREALEKIAEGKDYTYEEALVKSVLKKAIIDQDQQMIKLIWNYLDGMPPQTTNLNLNQKIADFFDKITDEDTKDQQTKGKDKLETEQLADGSSQKSGQI